MVENPDEWSYRLNGRLVQDIPYPQKCTYDRRELIDHSEVSYADSCDKLWSTCVGLNMQNAIINTRLPYYQ